MLKSIGFRNGPEIWLLAGDATCGLAFAWRSVAQVTVGFGWPPVWGYRNNRRWAFVTIGVVTIGWRVRSQ